MGGSVGFGGVTPHTKRWVSQISFVKTRPGSFVWLTITIQNLLNCDGMLSSLVKGAYWKLSSTGSSLLP